MHSFEYWQTRNATSRRLCFEKCQFWVFTSRCVSYAITLSGQTVIQRWYSVKHKSIVFWLLKKLNGVVIVTWIELLHFICPGTNFTMNFTMFVEKKCYLCMGFTIFLELKMWIEAYLFLCYYEMTMAVLEIMFDNWQNSFSHEKLV